MSCENGNRSLGDNQGVLSQSKDDEGKLPQVQGKLPQGQVKPSQEQEKPHQEQEELSHKNRKKELKDEAKERKFLFEQMIYEKDNGGYEKQIQIRSVLYSSIIKEYSLSLQKDLRSKRVLKIIFFSAIVAILIAITAMFAGALFKSFSLIKTTQNKDNEFVLSLLLQAASTIAAVLASILVLPKIIANYLFDPKEENATISIIEKIQNYDSVMYPMMNSASVNVFEFESKKEKLYSEDPDELEDLAEAAATQEEFPLDDDAISNTSTTSVDNVGDETSQDSNEPPDDTPSRDITLDNEYPQGDNSLCGEDSQGDNSLPEDDPPKNDE